MSEAREKSRKLFAGDASGGPLARALRAISGRAHWFSDWKAKFSSEDDAENAFAIFPRWVTGFHQGDRTYGDAQPLISDRDTRIALFNHHVNLTGRRVVELGPLEAGHSKQMLDLGAASVTAIESNPEAFLKCLTVKAALELERLTVVFGDCNQVLDRFNRSDRRFDICSAVGVLYHMAQPLWTIRLVCDAAPCAYVWTHVASDRQPNGKWTSISDDAGNAYRGRINHYGSDAHLGGLEATSIWLTEESLVDAFRHRGRRVEVLDREAHPHGDAVSLIATTESSS